MKKLLTVAVMTLFLPGCAVAGIGLAALTADNVANGEDSYTNEALDYTCDRTSGKQRLQDGSCPAK